MDLPKGTAGRLTPFIRYDLCVGCGACAEFYPLLFVMRDDRAWVINHEEFDDRVHSVVVRACPFRAITIG